MSKNVDVFFALLRSAMTKTNEDIDLSGVDLEELLRLANAHDLAHLVCYELERRGLIVEGEGCENHSTLAEGQVIDDFVEQLDLAMFRHINREIAVAKVREVLEGEKIPFIILKGTVLMDFYPEPWMRTSSDVDVLVSPDDFVRAVAAFKQSGLVNFAETDHDLSFYTTEEFHVELHHSLIDDDRLPDTTKHIKNIWNYSKPSSDGKVERTLNDEMFYFYHIAHMAKHFKESGCGIRYFMDIWVLNHATSFEKDRRNALLADSGIKTFAEKAEKISEIWFSGAKPDPELDEIIDFLINGGIYGSLEYGTILKRHRKGSRVAFYIYRLFMPYDKIKYLYPVLQKVPILLPIFWVVRWFKLLNPKVRRHVKQEIAIERSSDACDAEKMENMMRKLEIL